MALIVAQTTGLASVTTNVVIAKPGSATNGDLLLLAFTWDNNPTFTGIAPGWNFITAVSANNVSGGSKLQTNLYWKKASSEPAQYSGSLSFAGFWSTQFVVVRGQNGSSTALDSTSNISAAPSATLMVSPALTLSHAGSLRIIFTGQIGNSGASPTHFEPPSGYTDHGAQLTSTVVCAASFSKIIAASGVDAAVNISTSNQPAVHPWVTVTIGIAASGGAAAAAFAGWMCLQGVGR